MKKALALVLALILVLSLVACGKSEESSGSGLVGSKWVCTQTGQTIELKGDGKMTWSGVDGTWTENEGLITINYLEYNGDKVECYFDVLEEEGNPVLKNKEYAKINGEQRMFTVQSYYPEDKTESVRSSTVKQLGNTVSTDIVDFTLKDAQFSYYASALATTYAEPREKSDGGIFTVAKGRVFVCMTFTIKNTDRDDLNVGGTFTDWNLGFTAKYKGKNYPLKAFDLNDKDGSTFGMSLRYHAESTNGGNTWNMVDSDNAIIGAGASKTIRVVEVAKFDPDSLNDSFELTVNIPNSSGQYEYYTYEVK